MEAMAARILCIGTTVGGIPEIIEHDKTGFLVRTKDENALAEAMIKAAEMPEEKRQKVIDNSRQKVYTHYAHESTTEKMEKTYREVLEI